MDPLINEDNKPSSLNGMAFSNAKSYREFFKMKHVLIYLEKETNI